MVSTCSSRACVPRAKEPCPDCGGVWTIAAPSAVNPLERNVVISPAHRDFGRVVPGTIRPFVFDRRLAVV